MKYFEYIKNKLTMLLVLLICILITHEVFAQDYEFSLRPRRAFDQIIVEIWAKSLNSSAAPLGNASLVIKYNTSFLYPALTQNLTVTDTISKFDASSTVPPIKTITSGFNNANGYSALTSTSYSAGFYSLEINHLVLNELGVVPENFGRGSFIGKLTFDIIGNPSDSDLADIIWSTNTFPGEVRIFDSQGNDIKSKCNLINTDANFKVIGVTFLSPIFNKMVIDRDANYLFLTGEYANSGYPVYFERSVNPNLYSIPTAKPVVVDESLAYLLEFSLDNGVSWQEIGRAAETEKAASMLTKGAGINHYKTGEIFAPEKSNSSYILSTQTGGQINLETYRQPLRLIISKNLHFISRSEQARLKITLLNKDLSSPLTDRLPTNIYNISAEPLVLGRLFFKQLNGVSQYIKSSENYSNSTQLTVSAWINLNSYPAVVGAEPAIVASSAGIDARPSFGSNEGDWMLYLKNGRIPAFRAREILNRGNAGTENYIGICEAYSLDTVPIASSNSPLSEKHADNWTHIAATVKDNVISLYVNGLLVSKVTNNNANDIRMMVTDHPIWIGVNPNIPNTTNNNNAPNVNAGRYLNAGIKEVQIWRTALTQEQIRAYASGIAFPDSISNYDDVKKALEIYYTLEGNLGDAASNPIYQKSRNNAIFYDDNISTPTNNILSSNILTNNILNKILFINNRESQPVYRPDRPHIIVSSPSSGSGVLNKQNDNTTIGWLAYGIGDITKPNSKDLEIQYSIDDGNSWHYVKNPAGNELTGQFAPDAEAGEVLWQPYQNNNPTANLRTLTPYAKTAKIRISGTALNEQSSLFAISKDFTIAPYFSINTSQGSIMQVAPKEGMNITGNYAYIEAWIKPYRFATAEEVYLPLVEKASPGNDGSLHYSFGITENGQLSFVVRDISGRDHIATTSMNHAVSRPNLWTHVAVLFIKKNSNNISEARFYIDGVVEDATKTVSNFNTAIELDISNTYPLFIGYKPGNLLGTSRSFIGEFKEVRFWNGLPNNLSISGAEPTPLTVFIQAAQAAPTSALLNANKLNLHSAFSMDGGTFDINGNGRAVAISENNGAILHNYGVPPTFLPFQPFFKLVEPTFRQFVSNSDTNVRVRWVGLHYDALNFSAGAAKTTPPSIEYSIRGGGGNIIQPYQYVGSLYWTGNKLQSLKFPDSVAYLSKLTGHDRYVAMSLNASIADPDVNKDGVFNDQGPLSPSLTNARLRLTGSYTINGEKVPLQSEGPLFTITPTDNFTVRVMLEGYHNGNVAGKLVNNIGTSYNQGGLRIQLYSNLSGELGEKVGSSAESIYGFSDRDPANLYKNKMNFGNAKFVFNDVPDGNYWLLVEHINHLPIMSRYPVPFFFTGDITTTLAVESGWDFLSWDGVDHNVMPKPDAMPWTGRYYTARGTAVNNKNDLDNYVTTGLIYNGGASLATAALPAMVGGDVNQDKMINAADRVLVRQETGLISPRSDVTGDKYINAIDRTIVDRNFGRVSSLYNITIPNSIRRDMQEINIYSGVAKEDTTLSKFFNRVAYLFDSSNSKSNFNYNYNSNLSKKTKNNSLLGISYDVSAEPEFNYEEEYVDLNIYITNRSDAFAPANCTFAVSFNSEALNFSSLEGADSVVFNSEFDFNKLPEELPKTGYLKLKSAPYSNSNNHNNVYNNIRSIEIDYDAYTNLGGINLTNTKTYLGTLRFKVKSNTGVISFNWHESKAVLTTNGNNITEYGNWMPIKPILLYSAKITSPNGGEKYSQNKKQKISWTATANAKIHLEFSSNAGISWNKITDTSISAKLYTYNWTTPNYSSTSCLIRIVDAETGIEIDRSDSVFSVVAPYGYIINPYVSNEPFRGGSKSSIEWYVEGADCVYFEFSSDGGSSWTPVTGKYMYPTVKTAWNVPRITTKRAIIRMRDCENDAIIAQTGEFKILNGVMNITYPRAKELVNTNKIFKVRWTQQYVEEFDLDLSIDNGVSWSRVATNIVAKNNFIDWLPPDVNSDEAVFRAIYNGDETMEYCRSNIFRIKGNSGIVDHLPAGINISQIYPNPATNNIYFDIILSESNNLKQDIYLNLSIINLAGSNVKTVFNKKLFTIGEHQIVIDVSDLPVGKYFAILQGENILSFREIIIK